MGPVVALIGLELSGTAASNAGLLDEAVDPKNMIVFLVTLGVAVFGSILFRGFLSVIPILIAVIFGICGRYYLRTGGFHTGCECPYICHSQFFFSQI